ncbi:MAG: V-type ATP synthase subunit I [Simkaniaceae bacterium]
MIIDLKKILFIGAKEDLNTFFSRVQKLGCVEFLSKKKKIDYQDHVHKLVKAIKILKKLPEQKEEVFCPPEEIKEKMKNVIDLEQRIDQNEERLRLIEAEKALIAPFGDFSIEEIAILEKETNRQFQFFCMNETKYHEMGAEESFIYVGSEYDMAYFVRFSKVPIKDKNMIEMQFKRSLSELNEDKVKIIEETRKARLQLVLQTAFIPSFRVELIQSLNEAHLYEAKEEAVSHLDDILFTSEAYLPVSQTKRVLNELGGLAVHFEEVEVEAEEKLPTHMENKGLNRIGEDLVHVYDTPATTDRDPSGWVFWAFILFFAMIVSDGGYGFLYLTLGLILKFKVKKWQGSLKRLSTLIISLGLGCTLWGIATSSYFGIDLKPTNKLTQFSLIHHLVEKKAAYHMEKRDDVYEEWVNKIPDLASAKTGEEFLLKGKLMKEGVLKYVVIDEFNQNLFLEFSLLIGVIHIALSLFRYLRRDIANLGWISFMIGGYLFFPSMLKATSLFHFLHVIDKQSAKEIGYQMLFFGIGFSVITALIQHRLKGIAEITKVIQIFSDVLSYLRLYALGLAGMIMASTFNSIGGGAQFFFGVFILLIGHAVNMTLGIMGGVIHGLRLNFLEWYHYSFDGGGKLFNPLRYLKRSSI